MCAKRQACHAHVVPAKRTIAKLEAAEERRQELIAIAAAASGSGSPRYGREAHDLSANIASLAPILARGARIIVGGSQF